MSDRIEIGRCKDCRWRKEDGYCWNVEKICEDCYLDYSDKSKNEEEDRLIYDYDEGGGFWVGPNFGCVHWTKKQTPSG